MTSSAASGVTRLRCASGEHRWESDATGVGYICMTCGDDDEGVTRADGEPTEAELRAAQEVLDSAASMYSVMRVARALAYQRAEIHARYEAVAVHLARNAEGKGMPAAGSYDRGVQIAQSDAANRIRQAAQ